QSIMSYNGGAVMAMKGKNCVAIAADRRFGIQAQMVTTDFQKIFPMGDRLYIGLAGLATDVQTVQSLENFRSSWETKTGIQKDNQPLMELSLIFSSQLAVGRAQASYTEGGGFDPASTKLQPPSHIFATTIRGAEALSKDSEIGGACGSGKELGPLETVKRPDQDPEHLFETISQAMLNAVDRDAVSGMGVIVHIIEKDKITTRTLKARMD
uniref:Proteasome subunit beta n=1 Tax=Otolemur garnettii TaxID=30611 RepID=H0WZ77_OTOGA